MVTNAFKHAFEGMEKGEIRIILEEKNRNVHAHISDNGIGLPEGFEPEERESLGMTLIHNFMTQLEAEGEIGSNDGVYIDLTFDISDVTGSSDSGQLNL
jgi:two-component sensor histidine kinase